MEGKESASARYLEAGDLVGLYLYVTSQIFTTSALGVLMKMLHSNLYLVTIIHNDYHTKSRHMSRTSAPGQMD